MSVVRRMAAGALLALWVAAPAMARVGGGQSYGGGGGSSDHGGSDSIFFVIDLLLRLVFAAPAIGIPLVIALLVWIAWMAKDGQLQAYSSDAAPPPEAWRSASDEERAELRADDPNFSETLFIDFVQLLYTRFHSERADAGQAESAPQEEGGPCRGLVVLAPWFDPRILASAEADVRTRGITKIADVLVGSSHIDHIEVGAEDDRIEVTFEANFTEHTERGPLSPLYVTERWELRRRKGVLSKGPGDITALVCPSCASPSELRPDGACPYCGQVVNHGDFAWVVARTEVLKAVPRPPIDLVGGGLLGGGVEAGTDLPTRYAPDFAPARRAFQARYPDFSWEAFEQRVRFVFLELQQAWSTKKWATARPYETDALFNRHRYWMEMYARQGLTNKLEDIEVRQVVPVKIMRDAWYDAITLRIFASMRDYTVNAAGETVSGNPREMRPFSEYWTFIRSSTARGASAPQAAAQCPNCGAPLDVNMAGDCAYCATKITSGAFDWVLSSIEQDEAFRG